MYVIAVGNDYPPFDFGVLTGLNVDVTNAVCDANDDMTCSLVDAPYDDCFDVDGNGDPVIGAKLMDGTYDGCMGWFITQTRKDLGISFSDDFALGLPTNLIAASTTPEPTGTDLGGAVVGTLAGFFNDEACLMRYYSNFTAMPFGGDTPRADALAALADGTITFMFWDAAPPIEAPADTKYVGDPIGDCPDEGLALAAYGTNAASLVADFNTGLATIRTDGTLESLCTAAITAYGGNDPNCVLGN